jgi:apolipoprotein N-acyltransferase
VHPSPLELGGAVLSGVLVVLSFPLFGREMGLDALVWVCLVPFLLAARGSGWSRGLLLGGALGLVLEGAGFIWILVAIRRFTELPWPLATFAFLGWLVYSSIPWALLGAVLGRSSRPAGIFWTLAFWVGLEHCYPRLFPWHLGGALYGREWLVQGADLFGASGLTVLVFLANAVIVLVVGFVRGRNRFPAGSLACLAALLAGLLIYGPARLTAVEEARKAAPSFRAVLVQGFRDPRERGEESLAFYIDTSRKALSAREADLLVWPEGADPWPIDLARGADPWRIHRAAESGAPRELAARPFTIPLATGGTGYDAQRIPRVSGILLYARPGEPPLFYEKNIRMPFGEVIPLVPESLLERLGVPVRTIARGTDNPPFPFRGKTFRSLICYEAVFPGYFRRTAEGADFLVNVTEDMWYGRTAHIPQHASVLRLRAVENRIPLLRVSNVGPSGVFDLTGGFRGGQKVYEEEVVFVEWRAASLPTIYARGGHLLPQALFLLALLRGAFLLVRSRRRPPPPSGRASS